MRTLECNCINLFWETIKEDYQRELEFSILKGCCPNCLSKNIKYREFITNREFGFECFDCKWQRKYSHQQFEEFSTYWVHHLSDSQDNKS